MSEKIETEPALEKSTENPEAADDLESTDDFEAADDFERTDGFEDVESSEDELRDEPEPVEADSQTPVLADEGLGEQEDLGSEPEDDTSTGPASALAEPLLASASAGAFLDRWSDVQAGFIEDPHRSVTDADALLTEVVSAFQEAVEQRRARISAILSDGTADTEDLRLALLDYRAAITTMLPAPDGARQSGTAAPVSNW
ncbi:MAG: hypothetical protein HOW97_05385 [Catenulispora sp.]|nr:hypothetical protein [Catenulispora sp.]